MKPENAVLFAFMVGGAQVWLTERWLRSVAEGQVMGAILIFAIGTTALGWLYRAAKGGAS